MGILGLARLIADVCPKGTVKEVEMKSYFGRRIAIDASMSLYQFMIAIRHSQDYMTNEAGETTSHIVGFFYRTCKMLEMGIKPVYVFDGKPPVLKGGTLNKRKEAREKAMKKLDKAKEAGTKQEVEKYTKRLTRITKKHNEDVKKLLSLMGLPVIESPSEAEAQCAQLCKEGLVYAVATEDMDALTFGAPKLVRKFTSGVGDKIQEYDLAGVLKGLDLNHDQFIDLCILMGCDYCGSIKGIGPKKGLDLIQKYSSIENILKEKYEITEFVDDVEIVYSNRRERTEQIEKSQDVNGNGTAEEAKANGSSFQDVKDKIKETVDKEVKALNREEVKTEGDEEKPFPGMEDEKDISDDELNRPEQEEDSRDNKDDSFEKKPEDDEEDEEKTEPEDEEDEEDSKSNKSPKKKKASKKAKAPKRDIKADVPENWLFIGARKLFTDAQVSIGKYTERDLKMKDPDEEGLINFLVKEHSFSEDRVRSALKRIKDSKPKASQTRIDSFFKVLPKDTPTPPKKTSSSTANKRKNEPAKGLASAGKKGRNPK